MAFIKYAKAQVIHAGWNLDRWGNFLGDNRQRLANSPHRTASSSPNLIQQASEILQEEFDPDKYLLTHSTIVASVDTFEVPNVKLGAIQEGGRTIQRKWSNYRVTPETAGWTNNNCFVPGTLITMADGTVKPIEEIQTGDEVLSHLGRVRKVRAVMDRYVDEEIYEIHPRGTTERVYATGEHPFFVFRENACVNCGVPVRSKATYNTRCISSLIGGFYCSKECWYEKKVRKAQFLLEKTGEFVEAKDLTNRDFTSTPLVNETVPVDLTLGQARLLGLFVAEGFYELDSRNENARVGAMWAFHSNEATTLAKTVCDLMHTEFGVECVIRYHKRDLGISVTTRTNRDVAAFFSHWVLGEGSTTKTLHPDLLRADKSLQMEVVRGWLEGDGCLQDTATAKVPGDIRITGDTASRSLANQMQMILRRIGVSSRLTRTESPARLRLVVDGETRVVNDPSKPKNVSWAVGCGGAWIDELVQGTVYEDEYLLAVDLRGGVQQAPALRFLNGYELQIIQSIRQVDYSGPVYNFDVEEDHSYIANGVAVHNCDSWDRPVLLKSYRTFIGGQNFCEHVQLDHLSKGRIIDAVARDIGPSVYVDILTATNRKHAELIRDINEGRMGTLSMGCSVTECACTKCGNVATDESDMCAHIKYEKGNSFFDEQGQRHSVAELCGHHSIDPTGGVHFIEASWVATPAFTGAVLRNILEPEVINLQTKETVRQMLASPPSQWTKENPEERQKAARVGFDFGDEGEGDKEEPAPKAPSNPLEDLEGEVEKYLLDKVKKRIKDKLQQKVQEDAASSPGELATSTGNQIVHQGSMTKQAAEYRAGIATLVRIARCDTELIDSVARLNQQLGVKVSREIYVTSLRVGSTAGHDNLGSYLTVCSKVLGRKPTMGEAKTLVRLGQILSLRK